MSTPSIDRSPRDVNLAIGGMSCGHCVAAVRAALADLPGVELRQVAVGTASLSLDETATSEAELLEAVRDAGYDARVAARPLPQAAG